MGDDERIYKELYQPWMEEWLRIHLFYNGLNAMSKYMLDTTVGGIFIGRPVSVTRQLLDNMQNNNEQ
jgi:hypothetical protein